MFVNKMKLIKSRDKIFKVQKFMTDRLMKFALVLSITYPSFSSGATFYIVLGLVFTLAALIEKRADSLCLLF